MTNPTPVRSRGARTGTAVAAVLAAAGFALVDAPAAFAAVGDSGDLTVASVGSARGNSQPGGPVCGFRLVANNFETLPAIPWTITSQPPRVPPGDTLAGTLPLSQGRARSAEYRLPEGTYQLQWVVPAGGVTKQKTFVVRCSEEDRREGGRPAEGRSESGRPAEGRAEEGGSGSGGSESGRSEADRSEAGKAEEGKNSGQSYHKPSGAVPAGGGGVPTMETVGSQSGSSAGTTAALTAGAAGVAGLILIRRAVRRRARGEA